MNWTALVKKFPKFVVVVGVIAVSTGLFGLWLLKHGAQKRAAMRPPPPVEDISGKLALIESKWDHLLLADDDLYDIDDGSLIFHDWLKQGVPIAIFYDEKHKKIIARYERGYVRYALDGTSEAAIAGKQPLLFSPDRSSAYFVKEKDIWRADVNWDDFKLENERRLTSIEQFAGPFFVANAIFNTGKTLVIRNLSNFLRVDVATGDVKPMRLRLDDIGKRRSPDSKWLVGIDRGQFYCYDVDANEMKTLPASKNSFTDCQWLDNDRCVLLLSGKSLALYNRPTHTLVEVLTLPAICLKIGDPSPTGRYIFCAGNHSGLIADLDEAKTYPLTGGNGFTWINDNTFVFSRDLPDSSLRGLWLKGVAGAEQRIASQPTFRILRAPNLLIMMGKPSTIILAPIEEILRAKSLETPTTHILQRANSPGQLQLVHSFD